MDRLLWICLGGAAGTGARYLLAGWMLSALGPAFPYGTLAVNAIGSFLLGLLTQIGLATEWMSPTLRLALATGVMGGFTTYSTFSYETLKLIEDRALGMAALNVCVTVIGCLATAFLGMAAGRWIAGA